MKRDRSKRLLCTIVFIVALAAFLNPVGAQERTPVTSDALECPTDERLATEKLRELGATSAPEEPHHGGTYVGGATPPPGTPADEETVAAATTTVHQYFACVDAGDWTASYALYADDTLRFLVTDRVRELFDIDPTTADYPFLDERLSSEGRGRGHIDVDQVTLRPDGQVGAVIEIENDPKGAKKGLQYIVLTWEDGRWRLVGPLGGLAAGSLLATAATPVP